MSIQMMTKAKKTETIDGDFDDEEMMKLFSSFDIEARNAAGAAKPLLVQLEALAKTNFAALRAQFFVSEDEDFDQAPAWQAPETLLATLESFRKILDHEGAPYLTQQIWADQSKPVEVPPSRKANDEYIEAIDDVIVRVEAAMKRKAVKVRLYFDPALL